MTLRQFFRYLKKNTVARVFKDKMPVADPCEVRVFKKSIPYHELKNKRMVYMAELPAPYGKIINIHVEN